MPRRGSHFRDAALFIANGTAATATRIVPIDHSAGDAQFLDGLPASTCVLRPMLGSEIPPLVAAAGAMMLLCTDADGSVLRTVVTMPPHRRKNTKVNVHRAIAKLRRLHPSVGQMFAEMNRGR